MSRRFTRISGVVVMLGLFCSMMVGLRPDYRALADGNRTASYQATAPQNIAPGKSNNAPACAVTPQPPRRAANIGCGTGTPVPTASGTPQPSGTPTCEPGMMRNTTAEPSVTVSATPESSPTDEPPSPTPDCGPQASGTPSEEPSGTPTAEGSPTSSETPSPESSPSESETATPDGSGTPSETATPDGSSTPSESETPTPGTPTDSPTPTPCPSPTPTATSYGMQQPADETSTPGCGGYGSPTSTPYYPSPTDTPVPSNTPTATPTPDCSDIQSSTDKGDDIYDVNLNQQLDENQSICTEFDISRYYGTVDNYPYGNIESEALGDTIVPEYEFDILTDSTDGTLTVEVNGESHDIVLDGLPYGYADYNSQILVLPALALNGEDPPPNAPNKVKITNKAAHVVNVLGFRVVVPGFRPLVLAAGFNINATVAADCRTPVPPSGVNHCLEQTDDYFNGWVFNAPEEQGLVYTPPRDGHAGLVDRMMPPLPGRAPVLIGGGGENMVTQINSILRKTGASKVNILGHSMGGLWGRAAIYLYSKDGGKPPVDKMMMLGTPNTGSPWADGYYALLNQECKLEQEVGVRTGKGCRYFYGINPALNHLRIGSMTVANSIAWPVESGVAHLAPGDGKPVTYASLAGDAQPCNARSVWSLDKVLSTWIGCPNDQVVPGYSVDGLPNTIINPGAQRHFQQNWNRVKPTLHQNLAHDPMYQQFFMTNYYQMNKNNYEGEGDFVNGSSRFGPIHLGISAPTANASAANIKPEDDSGPAQPNFYVPLKGQLQSGQSQTSTIAVDNVQNLNFDLNWMDEEASLSLSLIDPAGRIINPDCSYSGCSYISDVLGAGYSIANPMPGNWQVVVTANSAPAEGELYTVMGTLDGGIQMSVSANPPDGNAGQPVEIDIDLGGNISDSTVVTASVAAVGDEANSVIVPLSSVGGGRYVGNYIPPTDADYNVEVEAIGMTNQGYDFSRMVDASFEVTDGEMAPVKTK